MTLGPAETALRAYIAANFSTCPVVWPNERLTDEQRDAATFIFAEVQGVAVPFTQASISSAGNRLFEIPGVLLLNLYTQFGSGVATRDAIFGALMPLLARKDIAAPAAPEIVRTEDPVEHPGERDPQNGPLYRNSFSIGFDYHHYA